MRLDKAKYLSCTYKLMRELSATCIPKNFVLILGSLYLKEIPFVTATVETGAAAADTDKVVLVEFNHKSVSKVLAVNVAGIEKKMVRRNGEQRLRQLLDIGH